MKYLGNKNGLEVFAPRVNEDTSTALDQISERLKCEFSYVGVTTPDDLRANGYQELIDALSERVDFEKYNLIIVNKIPLTNADK
jgi:hypothetical protein